MSGDPCEREEEAEESRRDQSFKTKGRLFFQTLLRYVMVQDGLLCKSSYSSWVISMGQFTQNERLTFSDKLLPNTNTV